MDPLSELFKKWQPIHPASRQDFVRDVMRRIRQEQIAPQGKGGWKGWGRILDEWLPSPAVLVPACAAVMLIVAAFQWNKAVKQAKEIAALQWHEEISKPFGKVSISGTIAQSNSDHAQRNR